MLTITGTIAVGLILLVGPYRTLQLRWRWLAPPFLLVWVHSNLATIALGLVLLHLVFAGFPKASLTWLAATLFFVAFGSGLYGLYRASTPSRRRGWMRFHRRLNWVFYLVLLPHLWAEALGIPLLVLTVAAIAFWQLRSGANTRLLHLRWPFHKGRRSPSTPR